MTQQPLARRDTVPFASVLLLADREPNAATDKIALRAAGISRMRSAPSGLLAARHLAAKVRRVITEETEVVICLPRLTDMNAMQFAGLIRSHPLLAHIPLLAITAEPGQEAALKKSGFNGVLLRPYTTTALENMLHTVALSAKARQEELLDFLSRNPGVPSHEEFDRLLKNFAPPDRNSMSPEAAYRHGVHLMREYQWEEALPFLEKAASDTLMRGDASMALAAFWTISQDPGKARACLLDALQAFMESQSWNKARQVSHRLGKEFPDAPSPVLPELERRARQNQYEMVARLVDLARDIATPAEISQAILKGGRAALTPGLALSTLTAFLRENGHSDLADSMAAGAGLKDERAKPPWIRFRRKKESSPLPSAPAKNVDIEFAPHPPGGDASCPRDAGGDSWDKQQAIAPLGQQLPGMPHLEPSPLGDVWTMIRGTLRLSKKKK